MTPRPRPPSQALRTDFYQLTMMQAYWKRGPLPEATFDYFVRRAPFGSYLLTAGLESVLDYIRNLRFGEEDLRYLRRRGFDKGFLDYLSDFRFTGSVLAMEEGSVAFPLEPVLRVTAPIPEAQLLETSVLNRMNYATLIATKASRAVHAARGRPVVEFGLRRAPGEAHLEATRAAYVGGCASTSNVLAGKRFGIPVAGTMAHSYVTSFESEIDAFRAYAEAFPDRCFLLIDTYDTLRGARKAVEVGRELEKRGKSLQGVRLDSGDLAPLSKQVRAILDEGGLRQAKIMASGDLNEHRIDDLLRAGAPIDLFGVGTDLVTARPASALDGIYKLADVARGGKHFPRMKLSEDTVKTTLPGRKLVWRFEEDGRYAKDLIALEDEKEAAAGAKPLLKTVVKKGKIVYKPPPLAKIQTRARENLARLPERYKALEGAPAYPVEFSRGLVEMRERLAERIRREEAIEEDIRWGLRGTE